MRGQMPKPVAFFFHLTIEGKQFAVLRRPYLAGFAIMRPHLIS